MSDAPERIWAVAESDFSAQTIDIIAAASPDGFVDKPSEYLRADIAARAHEEGHRAGYRQGMEEAARLVEANDYFTAGDQRGMSPARFPGHNQHHATIAAAIRAMMGGKG